MPAPNRAKTGNQSPYKHYLDDNPNFKRWYDNVFRGSPITASEYLRRIGFICKTFDGTTPDSLAKMDVATASDFLADVVTYFSNKGAVGTNIKGYKRGLKSWWSWNNINMTPKTLDKILKADVNGRLNIGSGPIVEVIGVYNLKTKELLYFEAFTSSEEADQAEMELQKRFHTSNPVFTDLGDLVSLNQLY